LNRKGYVEMKPAEQVKWMSRDVHRALVDLDFSMLDYQEDAAPYCARHPSDTHTEAHLTDLGRECRAYLLANPERPSQRQSDYEREVEAW
jgi:hypothetical protein